MIFLSSCSLNYPTLVLSSAPQDSDVPKSDEFYMFYHGENIDFRYEIISELNVTGGTHSDQSNVMVYLKQNAWSLGANGLINVETSMAERFLGRTDSEENFVDDRVHAVKGLAVRIVLTDDFRQLNSGRNDVSFQKKFTEIKGMEKERTENAKLSGIAVAFGATMLLAAMAIGVQH